MVLVDSKSGILAATERAQLTLQKLQLSQEETAQSLAKAQKRAGEIAENDANSMVDAAKQDGKNLEIALGVGAGLSIIGGILGGVVLGGGALSSATYNICLSGSQLAQTGAELGQQVATGLGQAAQEKAQGVLDIDQVGPKVIGQYTEDLGKECVQDAQSLQSEQQAIASYIAGQTQASKWN